MEGHMNPPAKVSNGKKATQAYYDRLSRWYDLLAGQAEEKCKQNGLHLLDPQPGEIILEIGFGTGHGLLALGQAVGEHGRVYGLDLSAGMLRAAQVRLRKAGYQDRVELEQGDALQLPYADSTFDALYMSFTLELFAASEIPLLLVECRRVLRINGRLSIVSMAKKEQSGLMVRLYEWAHRKWPVYIDCRPIHAQAEVAQAGFSIERRIEMSLFGLPVDIILAK
jgi:ubiquinone/menaquinone biosynthesis C-methylase UbiE